MLTLAIQAGGESRRMGTDKALLPFLGQPLVVRLLSRLAWIADEVIITSNQPENYRFLGLTPIPDLLPGLGALGGLHTALSAATHPYAAVVACDMPFASPEIFLYALAQLRERSADVVIPRTEAGMEPFHAVYRCEILPAADTSSDTSRQAPRRCLVRAGEHPLPGGGRNPAIRPRQVDFFQHQYAGGIEGSGKTCRE